LLGLLRESKPYGLVWEDKPEAVEERLRERMPLLVEVPERAILSEEAGAPDHILIESDNLDALVTLAYTHEGAVDVIYIDPPYNTGNRDFVYNDRFVDGEDAYRHSKWLSFMAKRLRIARKLLSDRGIVFISIDDNEQADLKLLCDDIFEPGNFIGLLPTVMNLKGNQSEFGFAGTHEYTLVYARKRSCCEPGALPASDEELDTWSEDEIGFYKKGATLKRTGADAPRESRPYGYFPILVDLRDRSVSTVTEDEYDGIYDPESDSFDDAFVSRLSAAYRKRGYAVLLPIVNGVKSSWRWGYKTVARDCREIIVTGSAPDFALYKKQRPELGEIPSKKPKSILYKAQYSSGNGTAQLKEMGLDGLFNNPKPIDLIVDLLRIGSAKNSTVLDFFAGSGTTLHAVMQLNAEDGGTRRCILCTDNENGICEKVTYERVRRAIAGYVKPDGAFVEGLRGNSLRYYRVGFVDRDRSVRNMRRLVALATDMLRVKEGLYAEREEFGGRKIRKELFRCFAEGGRQMLVVYREEAVPDLVDLLDGMEADEPLRVYVFSPSEDPWEDEFEPVDGKVRLCALPQAIYNVYRRVLPKKRGTDAGRGSDPSRTVRPDGGAGCDPVDFNEDEA